MNLGYIFIGVIAVHLFILSIEYLPDKFGHYADFYFTKVGYLIVFIPCIIFFLYVGNVCGIDNTFGIVKDAITLNLGIDDYARAGEYAAQKYGDEYEYSDNMNNYEKGYDAPIVYRVRPFSYNNDDKKIELIKSFTSPEIECAAHLYGFDVFYEDINIGKVIVKDKLFYDEYILLFDMQEYNAFLNAFLK